jgi:phospholipid/cholesterol/gamma-HCH transport system substrate-binding protein
METSARYILVGLFTLIAIVVGFCFVYWLNNNGAVGEREAYQIHFLGPVSGLQNGAAVQLNGIHVGEVTDLRLDKDNQVVATIAILKGMTLRADTGVSVDFQGLMGTPLISLKGGSPGSPVLVPNPQKPPVLEADVSAGQDLTQTARGTLNRIDKILDDNATPLKDTIGSLKTFSAALARNSNRVDTILAGLEKMTGGGPAEQPKPIYDLAVDSAAIPHVNVKNQFSVPEPTAVLALDTQRMLTRSDSGQIAQFGNAQWSDNIPKLLQAKLVQALAQAGVEAQATTPDQAATATGPQLVIDLQNFALTTGSPPQAEIAFSAKIVSAAGKVVATKDFHAAAPAAGADVAASVAAFNKAFSDTVRSLTTWVGAAN